MAGALHLRCVQHVLKLVNHYDPSAVPPERISNIADQFRLVLPSLCGEVHGVQNFLAKVNHCGFRGRFEIQDGIKEIAISVWNRLERSFVFQPLLKQGRFAGSGLTVNRHRERVWIEARYRAFHPFDGNVDFLIIRRGKIGGFHALHKRLYPPILVVQALVRGSGD